MRILQKYIQIASLLMLLAIYSCSGPSMTDMGRIDRARILIASHPDSALALLDSLDYECLGKQKAYACYLKGRGKLNIRNYPDATTEFLRAEKYAKATDNDSVLKLALHGIMDLADSVCDLNIKAAFATRLCNIYFNENDFDNIYHTLSGIKKRHLTGTISGKYSAELEKLAERFRDCDTVAHRGEIVYNQIHNLNNPNIIPLGIIDGLQSFQPRNLIETIAADSEWQTEIDNKSAELSSQNAHYIATTLWEQGRERDADDFIAYISSHFTDHANREFRSSFRYDIKEAAKQFNHDEVLISEQIIRHQRILLCVVSLLALAIISLIGIYIHMSRIRRRLREEQNMLAAAELRSSFHNLEEENLGILSHLCDTYYETYANESAKSRTARETLKTIRNMASSVDFTARLEKHLDRTAEGVMSLMRSELPDLKDCDRNLFLYNALGLSIPSACLMLGERREVIYNRRTRLRAKIQDSDAPHKDLFLKYLR